MGSEESKQPYQKEVLVKPEHGKLTKDAQIFAAVNLFMIIAVFIYAFSGLAGINLPRYYPTLNQWSIAALEGPAMGFFAKVPFALIPATTIAIIFYLAAPWLQAHIEIRLKTFKNFSTMAILFGMMFFVVEEWHSWGIVKQKLEGSGFFNAELNLLIISTAVFLLLGLVILAIEKKIYD